MSLTKVHFFFFFFTKTNALFYFAFEEVKRSKDVKMFGVLVLLPKEDAKVFL